MTSPVATSPSTSASPRAAPTTGLGRGRLVFTLIVVGAIAWAGLLFIGVRLAQAGPPGVGFDLQLLVDAGRKAATGVGLYSPAVLAGQTLEAQSLFYSYPPFVAQAMAVIAWLPFPVILVAWAVAATALLALTGAAVARRLDPGADLVIVALALVAIAPLLMPFAIGVLFGNFNVLFPALYGLVLLAALAPHTDRRMRVVGGVALGVAVAVKIHPAALALWFLVRGLRERRSGRTPVSWEVLAAALATGAVLVGGSLAIGGVHPWLDYAAVVRASSGATLLDHRNYGPAAQVGLLVGLSEGAVRIVHGMVVAAALIVTVWAAWRRRDPVESLALAAVASLVMLPVTWIHYPVALLPFAVAAFVWDRVALRSTGLLLGTAAVALFLAIAVPPLLWVGVGLFLGALLRGSRDAAPSRDMQSPAARLA